MTKIPSKKSPIYWLLKFGESLKDNTDFRVEFLQKINDIKTQDTYGFEVKIVHKDKTDKEPTTEQKDPIVEIYDTGFLHDPFNKDYTIRDIHITTDSESKIKSIKLEVCTNDYDKENPLKDD